MTDAAVEIIREHFAEKRREHAAKWLEIEYYGPEHTIEKNREEFSIFEEERAALAALQGPLTADPRPVDNPRERLLELAAEARAAGDHQAEQAALVEVMKADRRPAPKSPQSESPAMQVLVLQLVQQHVDTAGMLPLWSPIEAAIVEALPASTKRERKLALARAGFGVIRDFQHGAGQLRLIELPAQDGMGAHIEEG